MENIIPEIIMNIYTKISVIIELYKSNTITCTTEMNIQWVITVIWLKV